MVEPIFRREDIGVTSGNPSVYVHRSTGSGKRLTIHSCAECATKLYVTFERFPEVCGVYGGTFDDPTWFRVAPDNARHIFLATARPDTCLSARFPMFVQHAMANDGTPNQPIVPATP